MELVIKVDTDVAEDVSDLKVIADALNKKLESKSDITEETSTVSESKTNITEQSVENSAEFTEHSVENKEETTVAEPQTILPTATAKEYSREEIARAMVQLRDLNGVPALMEVLKHFGVDNLMAVPSEKYNELVAILNEKGVKV